jgi:HlyD family secretion protein
MKMWQGGVLALALGAAAFFFWPRGGDKDAAPYRTEVAGTGDVVRAVSATGGLEPVVTVDVGSTISGPVAEVLVDFNARVEAGQVLARIDPQTFQARVNQLTADVQAQRSNLEVSRASLLQAEAEARNARQELARSQQLHDQGYVSGQVLDQRQTAIDRTTAAETLAQAQIAAAEARVRQSEASLASARVELERTIIRSPVNGVVVDRRVEPGQTVAASFNAPVLFQIAEDLSRLQAKIAVDEADIGEVSEALPVRFTVDAFPGREFTGQVTQVRKRGVETQGVVSYTVMVEAANPDGRLLPGMTANATIVLERREGVLRVPNAALRFRPGDPKIAALAEGLTGGGQGRDGGGAGAAAGGLGAAQGGGGGQGGGGQGRGIARMVDTLAEQLELNDTQREAARAAFERALASAGPRPDGSGGPDAFRAYFQRVRLAALTELEPSLTPEQKGRLEALRTAREGAAMGRPGVLWVLREGAPVPVRVRLGVADDAFTEVQGDALKVGDAVIIGGGPAAPAAASSALPGPGGGVRIRGA